MINYTNPKSRNASLALLKLYSHCLLDTNSKRLFKKCQKYFEDYSSKVACMRDLRPHIAGLSRSHQEMLCTNIGRQSNERCRKLPEMRVSFSNPKQQASLI